MSAKVIPLFTPPPEAPFSFTAALRGIADAIEEKCGLDCDDQVAAFGSLMTIAIDIGTKNVNVRWGEG